MFGFPNDLVSLLQMDCWAKHASGIWASASPQISLQLTFLLTGIPDFHVFSGHFLWMFSFWHPYVGCLFIHMWVSPSNMSLRSALLITWVSYYSIQVIYSHEWNLSSLCPQEERREVQEAISVLPGPHQVPESIWNHSMHCITGQQPQKGYIYSHHITAKYDRCLNSE